MATIAMILRSIASAPVGEPPGPTGNGTATRAAYQSTAPSTSNRKTAVISAGRLTFTDLYRRSGGRHRVGGVGHRARNHLRRAGLDRDPACPIDLYWEAIHRARSRSLDDLAVAVVDRPVAWALEAALVGEGLIAAIGRPGHRRVLRRPWHRAAEMRALPVQGEEPLGHARYVELAVADLLHIADFEVGHLAGYNGDT